MTITPFVLLALCALTSGAFLRRPHLDGRIVGGEDADISNYPHQLSLMLYGSHNCGASVISKDWVLTAAHCVDGRSASALSIRAGSSTRDQGGIVHEVAEVIRHEKYDRSTIDYDYAVIRVSTPFEFNDNVQPIGLVDSAPAAGDRATISGWGTTSAGGYLPEQLQAVKVPIVDHDACDSAYASFSGVTDRMICAGLTEGGKDSCQGDSGGPLIVNGKLAGIVSWGYGCAYPNYPGVYANVAAGREWITEKSGV